MPDRELHSLPFYNEAQVASVLEWPALIHTIEMAMTSLSAGQVEQPVRQMVPVPGHDAIIAAMPAVGDAMAVKVVTLFHQNAGTGIPTHQAVIMVFDRDNGTPLCVMDGRLITEMRTAAGSAAAARKLSRSDASILTIMGSGYQARAHAEAMRAVRPIEEIRLWSRTEANARRAAEEIHATYIADPEQAVRGADIVACTTSATSPILNGGWLKKGAFVASVGWNGHDGRELDDAVMANTVVVESVSAARDQAGNVRGSGCKIFAEVGEIFAGSKIAPDGATIVYDSVGVAIQDVVAAQLAYDLLTA